MHLINIPYASIYLSRKMFDVHAM